MPTSIRCKAAESLQFAPMNICLPHLNVLRQVCTGVAYNQRTRAAIPPACEHPCLEWRVGLYNDVSACVCRLSRNAWFCAYRHQSREAIPAWLWRKSQGAFDVTDRLGTSILFLQGSIAPPTRAATDSTTLPSWAAMYGSRRIVTYLFLWSKGLS